MSQELVYNLLERKKKPMSAKQIADYFKQSRSTTNHSLKKLADLGYIEFSEERGVGHGKRWYRVKSRKR